MAQVTGHMEDIPALDSKINSIKENFDKVFWKGDGYRSGANPDERANAMAVVAGLAVEQDVADDTLRDMAAFVGSHHALLGSEQRPPDTAEAFIALCNT